MIYTLTYCFEDRDKIIQWYDILNEQDYLDVKNIYHVDNFNTDEINNTRLYFNKNIENNFGIKSDEKSILILDSEYIFYSGNDNHETIHKNIEKLNDTLFSKIIIMSKDHFIHDDYQSGKVEIYSPNQLSDYHGIIMKKFNYYLINASYNKLRNTSEELFYYFKNSKKYKKFSLLMGSFKPFRTILYNNIKKYNAIDNSFLSYMSYNVDIRQETFQTHFFKDYKFDRNKLLEVITPEEFKDCKKNLPIYLDGNYSEQNFSILPPLNYLMNSYVQIVDCNVFSQYMYTDEKIFRPFLTFNIPIFFGPKGLIQLLKNYEFDLFEDIFDLSRDNDGDDIERFKSYFENIKKINSMSIDDLHNLYVSSHHRLEHNFNRLKEIGQNQVNEFIKLINEYN